VTVELASRDLADRLRTQFPELQVEVGPNWLAVDGAEIEHVARFVHDDPDLDLVYLTGLAGVDWLDYFEVVYHLHSLRRNHLAVVKARVDRDAPSLPSVSGVWYGAHLQEAEVYDLMGIRFEGHPNLRRLFLWEGFAGWPLRKDFLQIGQGAYSPGLPHFPKEGGERGVLSGPNWSAPAQQVDQGRPEPGGEMS
jgi:NADH-quinone oxidoreductase subunit C